MIGIIIPVLQVNEPCHWCEPLGCHEASIWWGEVLLVFYTTDATRLEAERLNAEACKILQEVTKGVLPDSETVIEPDALLKAMGGQTILCCFWDDFEPAVAIVHRNRVRISATKEKCPECGSRNYCEDGDWDQETCERTAAYMACRDCGHSGLMA